MRQLSENMIKQITKATIEIKCYNHLELGAISFFQIYFQSTDSESDVMSWVISPYSFNCNAFHTTDYSQCQIGKQNWLLHVFLILLLILNQIQRRSWFFLSCFYQFTWLLFKISMFFFRIFKFIRQSHQCQWSCIWVQLCSYMAWFKTYGRKGCWKGKWRWCHHITVAIRYDPVLEQQPQQVPHIRPQTTFRYIKWLKGNHEVFNNLPNLYFLYKFIMEYYTTLYIMIIFMFRK